MKMCRTITGLEQAIKNGEEAFLRYDEIDEGRVCGYVRLRIGDKIEEIHEDTFKLLSPYLLHNRWVILVTNNKKLSPFKGKTCYLGIKSGTYNKIKPVATLAEVDNAFKFYSEEKAVGFVKERFGCEVNQRTGDYLFKISKVNCIELPYCYFAGGCF